MAWKTVMPFQELRVTSLIQLPSARLTCSSDHSWTRRAASRYFALPVVWSYAEEWIDGIAATTMDDGAGRAEESTAECGVVDGGFLVGDEAVAPGLEELGVEVG